MRWSITKNKIFFVTLFIICIIALGVSLFFVFELRAENEFYQESIDARFQHDLASLCGVLNEKESDLQAAEGMKFAHSCFSLFTLTSYRDNGELNSILLNLYERAESSELCGYLDAEIVAELTRLSTQPDNKELIHQIYTKLKK